MTKKPLVGLVLVLLALGGVWLCWQNRRGWTVEKVERLITLELPTGCDRRPVEDWLDRHDMPHTYSILNAEDERYAEFAKHARLDIQNLGEVVVGHVFPANESLFFRSELDVFFFFDKHGSLVGHSIEVWFDFL